MKYFYITLMTVKHFTAIALSIPGRCLHAVRASSATARPVGLTLGWRQFRYVAQMFVTSNASYPATSTRAEEQWLARRLATRTAGMA
jgi:hypothetical protein